MVVFAGVAIVAVLVIVVLAVDLGHVMLVRSQLQVAADASAVAAASSTWLPRDEMETVAKRSAGHHTAAAKPVSLHSGDVEYGIWDVHTRKFTPKATRGNAVRVTPRTGTPGGVLSSFSFARRASAVATASPRDIALVVDLSGSMNDDTEPCPDARVELVQQVFDDFGFGAYPGTLQHVGLWAGVRQDEHAFAELSGHGGPLTKSSVASKYRIEPTDDEPTRKRKAYSALIDCQIAQLMPDAKPVPDSAENYGYWAKYLDYVIGPEAIDPDVVDSKRTVSADYGNKIGYATYVQFMLDHGRDLKPAGIRYVPLSRHSPDCPWHLEETAGGTFRFPPRTQPMHSVRRSLIAAIEILKQHNAHIADRDQRDWVSIITYDTLCGGGPVVEQPLTGDYEAAMAACARLQAVGDRPTTTATEAGLIEARKHLRRASGGGKGRSHTDKVVVLLVNGLPSLYRTDPAEITRFVSTHSANEAFYDEGEFCKNAALMQVARMRADHWLTFAVGVGPGTASSAAGGTASSAAGGTASHAVGSSLDDFIDRVARLGKTAETDGKCAPGGGDAAEYEGRLTEIFEQIITNPTIRLVQ